MVNEVVAHYIAGHLVKGSSLDVDPNKPTCHIKTAEQGMVEVKFADLKALFFVRDLAGDPAHKEEVAVDPSDARTHGACQIDVQFADGERVVGLTARFPPVRRFFYVVPADAQSNNIRILVNRAAAVQIGQPPGAAR
jgi:Family of unknown function (DUF6982)